MLYLMGRSLWFGAGVVSVRDEGTASLPSFAPNSIMALENELFVASPLMPSFAGTGAMEESLAAIVAALLRCDEGCNCSVVATLSRVNRPCRTQCCSAKCLISTCFSRPGPKRVAMPMHADASSFKRAVMV